MTAQEIHNAINLGLQKAGSFAYDNIKDEFIDMAFNRMGDAFITEKTTRELDPKRLGFEENQARLANIRELVTEATLTVYNDIAQKRQYSVLPHNYFTFVEAQGDIVHSCNTLDVTFTTSSSPEYICAISFKQSDFVTVPANPFSETKIFKIISGTPTEIFDFSDFSTGLDDLSEIFTVINKIQDEINLTESTLKVYWEYYRGTYYPDQLVFVSSDATFSGQSIRVVYTASEQTTTSLTTNNYTKVSAGSGTNFTTRDSFCRLLSNEETFHMLAHPFGTTSQDSPILNILHDRLTVYINKRFILKGLTLKYIRKPRRMNLPLNQSYEIQDSRALSKIIDMTVEYLSATIQSQGLQALTMQNQQRD